ncbi:ATP synthase subunit I [Schlegelella sp. S2-27]|uniref:ATP synthase subunit I n=1 Tax=Caldimonas mangrovi TaxID=2944811 RepID=A0ABT0YUC7_9BURK|nr:ATP synthase subunit I [Caldimonas mangrovi]MCM5681691.1 ATP synthase subunit I [Caldimonas mangrovi]
MTAKHADHGELDTRPGADDEATFKSLSHEEAQALMAQHPPLSPWRVVAVQAAAGVVVAALWFAATREGGAAWSALYGAAAVVLPGALMARGLTSRISRASPGAAVFGFLFWESLKIALAVAMLVAAAKVVPDLSWPALLVTMVVCMKVSWLTLLRRGRRKQTS